MQSGLGQRGSTDGYHPPPPPPPELEPPLLLEPPELELGFDTPAATELAAATHAPLDPPPAKPPPPPIPDHDGEALSEEPCPLPHDDDDLAALRVAPPNASNHLSMWVPSPKAMR